jgi:hypothetical protein
MKINMKKLVFFLIALFLVDSLVQAQNQIVNNSKKEVRKEKITERKALRKLKGAYVSEISKANFYKDFGVLSNVVWTRSDYFDEAHYSNNGKEMKAYYDEDGNLVGTTSIIAFEELPVIDQKNVKKIYKDAVPGKVVFYDDNELNDTDMILYGTQFDDQDLYFVEMSQGAKKFVLRCDTKGNIAFFKQL